MRRGFLHSVDEAKVRQLNIVVVMRTFESRFSWFGVTVGYFLAVHVVQDTTKPRQIINFFLTE